jgi:hypothetical protein
MTPEVTVMRRLSCRVGYEGQRPCHNHAHRGDGLRRLTAELGEGYSPLACTGSGKDLFRDMRIGSGYPGGHRPQVGAHQRGGVEVAAQVVAGLGGPERAVLDTLVGDGESERVGAADGRRRVLASVDGRPAERRGPPRCVAG